MSANGPSFWDIAGQIYNALYAAPAVEDVKEAVQQVVTATQGVAEDLKEVATSTSSLGTTESASTVSNMSTALVSYIPALRNTVNSTADMCGLDEVPASSYLGYAMGSLGVLSGFAGLYGIRRLRAAVEQDVDADVNAVVKDSEAALALIAAHAKNPAVFALLNNKENMLHLLECEKINKGTLANLAKMKPVAAIASLQAAFESKVKSTPAEEIKEVSLSSSSSSSSSSSNAVVGTQAASSAPVDVASSSSSSSAPAPTPTAMDLMLAKIAQHAKTSQALALMNTRSRQGLEKTVNKMDQTKLDKILKFNEETLATYLVSIALACKQEIKIEGIEAKSRKQTALKM